MAAEALKVTAARRALRGGPRLLSPLDCRIGVLVTLSQVTGHLEHLIEEGDGALVDEARGESDLGGASRPCLPTCRGGRRQAPGSPRASTPMFNPSARAARSTMSSWTVFLPPSSWPMTLRLTPIESARSSWVIFSPRRRSRSAEPRAEGESVVFIAGE